MTMIATPLATAQEIVDVAKIEGTTQVLAEVNSILDEIDGILWSYVGNRYNLDEFTEKNLVLGSQQSKALALLTSITIQASKGRLLQSSYGMQMLREELNANYLYDIEVKKMQDIGSGKIRLLDINNKEMPLVPAINKSNNGTLSSFNKPRFKSFYNGQKR